MILKIINSLNKFNLGGEAILLEQNKNHHIDKVGNNKIIPLIINKFRVFNFS